jgi:cyclopropane-fatty-acyl-phospholipid synthase
MSIESRHDGSLEVDRSAAGVEAGDRGSSGPVTRTDLSTSGRIGTEGAAFGSAAETLRPLVAALFPAGMPLEIELWDGSRLAPSGWEPGEGTRVRLVLRSPDSLRYLVWAPGQLGLARAFVSGALDVEVEGGGRPGDGTLRRALAQLHGAMVSRLPTAPGMILPLLRAAVSLGAVGAPPAVPAAEVRLTSRFRPASIHTKERDAEAVRHHYDIGNDFYELLLGPAMTYSCARFERPDATLEEAQASKHELVCRKLGLAEPGHGRRLRLLDVGCGFGSMAMHAASRYDADVVGVTLSPAQADRARQRVREAGLDDRIEIRLQDYRDLGGERFDAVSSIGMFEHVGEKRMAEYFSTLYGLLAPRGRLLNHAISRAGGSKMRGRTFMNRYVFPDGELIDVGEVVLGMERAGFEIRDVESLREHYARTLEHWVANLEANWDEAVKIVGAQRARVWRLYLSASINGFEDGGIAIHQVLGVKRDQTGSSGMPGTRAGWG